MGCDKNKNEEQSRLENTGVFNCFGDGCKCIVVGATTIDRASNGPDSNVSLSSTTIYVPDNYLTIPAAVKAAFAGDTIIVRDGTYTENVKVGA